MGAEHSKAKQPPAGLRSPTRILVADATKDVNFCVTWFPHTAPASCSPLLIADLPSPVMLTLRIGREALYLCDPGTGQVMACFPYHRILCWGYTSATFQWKTFRDEAPAEIGDTTEERTPDNVAEAGENKSPDGAASVKSVLSSRSGEGGTETKSEGSLRSDSKGEEGRKAVQARPKSSRDENVDTYVVETSAGVTIEGIVMNAVKALMTGMETCGVEEREFAAVMATVESLADESGIEGSGETAIQLIKSIAAVHRFDIRQAVSLLSAVCRLSPFDGLEAAIVLYGALINRDSFPMLLQTFEDETDRENICHRLGIKVDDTGSIVALTVKAAAASKA
jgi:hypothetical protein